MNSTIVHEHFGLGPDGPEVREHHFPLAADDLVTKNPNLMVGESFSESDAWKLLETRFQKANWVTCEEIVDSELHSVAEMSDVFWLAMKHASDIFFFVPLEPPTDLGERLPNELRHFMMSLAGVWIGPYYFPDSGFLRSEDVVQVDFASTALWWGDVNRDWENATAFFSTPTGRTFLYHRDGYVGTWENGKFERFSDDLSSFAEAFCDSLKGRDEKLMFY